MSNSNALLMKNALHLSKQKDNECRITSLLLILKLSKEDKNYEKVFENVVLNVGHSFIERLFIVQKSTVDLTLPTIAVAILIKLCELHMDSYLYLYCKNIFDVLDFYFASNQVLNSNNSNSKNDGDSSIHSLIDSFKYKNDNVINMMQMLVSLYFESCADKCKNNNGKFEFVVPLMRRILHLSSISPLHLSEILGLFIYCCYNLKVLSVLSNSSLIPHTYIVKLTVVECNTLRSLFIQGLHGAAPRLNRHAIFSYLNILLCQYQNRDHILSEWTVELSAFLPKSTDNKTSSNTGYKGQFALFITIVVRGEIQLVIEEIMDLFGQITSSCNINDSNCHNVENNQQTKINQEFGYGCSILINVLLPLFQNILFMLVGGDSTSGSSINDMDRELLWSGLPCDTLLKLKLATTETVCELLDFIKWLYEKSQIYTDLLSCLHMEQDYVDSNKKSNEQFSYKLMILLKLSIKCVCGWVLEDSSLNNKFIKNLHFMIYFSVSYPRYMSDDMTIFEDKINILRRMLFENRRVDLLSVENETLISGVKLEKTNLAKTSISDYAIIADDSRDIIEYLLVCVSAIINCDSDDDNVCNQKGKTQTDVGTEVTISEQIFDQKNFFPCLVNTILCCCSHIFISFDDRNNCVNDGLQTTRAYKILNNACYILNCLLISKLNELLNLLPIEGYDAIASVLGYEVSSPQTTVKQLLIALKHDYIQRNESNDLNDLRNTLGIIKEATKISK